MQQSESTSVGKAEVKQEKKNTQEKCNFTDYFVTWKLFMVDTCSHLHTGT